MMQANNIRRFITIVDESGKRKKVRTEYEKARRKAEIQALKVFKEKTCVWCKDLYMPTWQYGTKRWELNKFCSRKCANASHNADPLHKAKKNAARRGNSQLHRREYLRRIELHGGTRWQLGDEKFRLDARRRNRERYKRLYGKDDQYTYERRANSQYQQVRRKKDKTDNLLSSVERARCKLIRIKAKTIAQKLGIEIHVDHLVPLKKGGKEHPSNLLIMRKEANLFWGDRIKACPWPRKKNWVEPEWEPKAK